MSSKANVTTPGGFFVGLGGIVSFSIVAAAVLFWVKKPAENTELRPQQIALGLRAAEDAKGEDVAKKNAETSKLLGEAAHRYNAGKNPNIDKLDDLRGVVRFREAKKAGDEAAKALAGAVAWKDKAKGEVTMPIDLAMKIVATGLKERKPKASAVKVDVMPALDPNAAPAMPNAMGGGAKTVIFADLNPPAPAAAPSPAPAAVPAPAPAAPTTPPSAPVVPAPAPGASATSPQPGTVVAAPARPTLLNWPESKK